MLSTASFPLVLGDFGCDATCQACRDNSPRTASRYRTRFQASSGNSDSSNWPKYEAAGFIVPIKIRMGRKQGAAKYRQGDDLLRMLARARQIEFLYGIVGEFGETKPVYRNV